MSKLLLLGCVETFPKTFGLVMAAVPLKISTFRWLLGRHQWDQTQDDGTVLMLHFCFWQMLAFTFNLREMKTTYHDSYEGFIQSVHSIQCSISKFADAVGFQMIAKIFLSLWYWKVASERLRHPSTKVTVLPKKKSSTGERNIECWDILKEQIEFWWNYVLANLLNECVWKYSKLLLCLFIHRSRLSEGISIRLKMSPSLCKDHFFLLLHLRLVICCDKITMQQYTIVIGIR